MKPENKRQKNPARFGWINPGIVLSDLKRFWWGGALYALVLFFAMPFMHYNHLRSRWDWLTQLEQTQPEQYLQNLRYNQLIDSLIVSPYDVKTLFLVTVPVFAAVLLFRYLHVVKQSTMEHSLPLNKTTLYCSHNLSGVILLCAPIVLNGIILSVLNTTTKLNYFYGHREIWAWVGLTVLFCLLFYFATVFVGMLTGNSIAQIVFFYILNVLPIGIYTCVTYILSHTVYGYSIGGSLDPSFNQGFLSKLPLNTLLLSNGFDYRNNATFLTYAIPTIILYIAMTIAFAILALLVYKVRHNEGAEDIVTINIVRPIFKWGVTTCVLLIGGSYFCAVTENDSLVWVMCGCLLGALIGFSAAEMLLRKSFRILKSYKQFLVYTGIVLIAFLTLQFDLAGYERYVPNPDTVDYVYFSWNWNNKSIALIKTEYNGDPFAEPDIDYVLQNMPHLRNMNLDYINGGYIKPVATQPMPAAAARHPLDPEIYNNEAFQAEATLNNYLFERKNPLDFYRTPENIRNVVFTHQQILATRQRSPENRGGRRFTIIYKLKSGRYISREYSLFTDIEHTNLYFNEYSTFAESQRPYLNLSGSLRPLLESMEYKLGRFPVLSANDDALTEVRVLDALIPYKQGKPIREPEELSWLGNYMREQIKALKYEEIIRDNFQNIYMEIHLFGSRNGLPYYLRSDSSALIDWLKQKDYYNAISFISGELDAIQLTAVPDNNGYPYTKESDGASDSAIKIDNPVIMEEIIGLLRHNPFIPLDENKRIIFNCHTAFSKSLADNALYIDSYPEYLNFSLVLPRDAEALKQHISPEFYEILTDGTAYY